MIRKNMLLSALLIVCASFLSATPTTRLSAQAINDPSAPIADKGTPGERVATTGGTAESNAAIMQRQAAAPPARPRPEHELVYPDRSNLPQNPNAPATSRFPASNAQAVGSPLTNIHSASNSFDGATLSDTGAFPPDSMGTVGPTQFIVFVNGRIRSFTKAGVADGVINADPDVFFSSVETPVTPPVVLNFTSDPQIRYDRFSGRWVMSIIDVPCTTGTCSATAANRWMVAVSDAASNGTISGSTVWTFFFFQADPGTNFCDYPSLGIDVNALYVGCNMFTSAGSFVGTNGYVVQKTSALGAGPIVVTAFANLAAGTGAGVYTPRGVDNFDSSATEGYFVGVDNAVFSAIDFRRISNPGSLTPTISANILVTVSTTRFPNPVEHSGNTGGANGNLDSLDDRLFQAMIRNGRLWTAHNIRVSAAGVASTAATARNGARWYEFQNLTTTPTVLQSGTVYDNPATRAAALQYWIPSITVTGQDHAVIGFSLAGTPSGATPAYTGRLSSDTLGTMAGVPGTTVVKFGTSTGNYNPPSDPGGGSGRRWGDYSFTVVDPLDDMSVWTIQEYNQALNSYAVRVGHLLAPPPATPTCSAGTPINFNAGTGNVVIAATSIGGSGFYDPGSNLPTPALPFSHLSATVTNATVNSATFNSPTQVTLNITANASGPQDVVITNPDGQNVSVLGCINVIPVFTVTAAAVGNGTITPPSQIVNSGSTASFTVTPDPTYHVVSVVGDTCSVTQQGATTTWVSSAISANCAVTATFAIDTYTVTSASGGNGTITPPSQTVNSGSTASFTVTPAATYHVLSVTGDTCTVTQQGVTTTWISSAISANCAVTATFAIDTFTVTATAVGNGTITPPSQTVNSGSTASFTVMPASGYHVVGVSGDTCTVLHVSGNNWTSSAISANCAVTATFAINTYIVTANTVGGNGTITPPSQTVNSDSMAAFVVTPVSGYHVASVTGNTCTVTQGAGNNWTSSAITTNCAVIAKFAVNVLVFTTQPANVTQGYALGTVVVAVQDGNGNTIIDNSSSVDFTIAACGGSVDLGNIAMVNGVATLNSKQVFYTLTSTPGLQINATTGTLNATSQYFNVLPNSDLLFADGFEGCRL